MLSALKCTQYSHDTVHFDTRCSSYTVVVSVASFTAIVVSSTLSLMSIASRASSDTGPFVNVAVSVRSASALPETAARSDGCEAFITTLNTASLLRLPTASLTWLAANVSVNGT